MLEASKETQKTHVFKTNELCVIEGYEDRKPPEVVIKDE
jgi:hypothetical protein